MSISNRLRELRISKKLTQSDVANKLGVERSTYGKYETGNSSADVETLKKIAEIYQVSLGDIVGYSEPEWFHRLDGYLELTDEDRENVEKYIEFLKTKYSK